MKKLNLLSTAVMALMFGACGDSQFDGYEKADNGLYYKFFNHDENGKRVQEGDGIIIRYVISKESNDSVVIDSKKVSSDGSGNVQFGMSKSSFKGSLEDGMMMMAKGDSASFIISADSFFLKTTQANELPKGFKPGEHLRAVIKIKDIKSKKELEENQKKQMEEQQVMMKEAQGKEVPAREKYLADNNITTKPTASGLIYIETKKGTGSASPKPTDIVSFNYTGKLLDGTPFDSNEGKPPVDYPLSQLIPGWVEAMQKMKKGGKAKLIIPSEIGYGAQSGGPIPPYSTLVFELELVDFKAAPEGSQQMPMPPAQSGQPGQ